MSSAASVPEGFFTDVTLFKLGEGGIVWEDDVKVLRSRSDGTGWTVADDIAGRDAEITYYNVSWRGGYDVDADPTYKKPSHEITWRGEYARNYHDGHPIPRRTGFSYNGTHYAGPAGQVLGGCVFVPTNGVDSGKNMIFIVEGAYNLHSKRVADLGTPGGWTALGQIPLGNTAIGGFEHFRSLFFSPDGSKAARTSWIWTTAKTDDDVEESDFTEYTMQANGAQLTQTTYDTYGPWTVALSGTQGSGGAGSAAMTNTGERPILGADYAPDGTLKTFAVSSWDVQGDWVDLAGINFVGNGSQDISLDFDGFIFTHINCDIHSEFQTLNQTFQCDFTEVHYADLRYGTFVYSDYQQIGTPTAVGISTWRRRVQLRHSSGNQLLFSYSTDGASPRIGSWLDIPYHLDVGTLSMLDGSNPQFPTEPFVLQKPYGDGWPDTNDYYQGNVLSPGSQVHAVYGLNLALAERTRPTDDDPAADTNTTMHWAAENHKGGLIIVLPDGDSVGGNDPDDLVFYMTGGQDLVALLADEGITVTIDRDDGHSYGHAIR